MILFEIEKVQTPLKGVCRIGSDEDPESLNIDGSDVTGLSDKYVLAAGSTLITPGGIYIAFEDGVFTKHGPAEEEETT